MNDPTPTAHGERRRLTNGKVVIWDAVNGIWGRMPDLDAKQDRDGDLREIVQTLMTSLEAIEENIRVVLDILKEQDKQIRRLELARRKIERKNVPVIVDPQGKRAN